MAIFNLRVVLHDATWDDYVKLAGELAKHNITDTLVSDDGNRYRMPPGEYQCQGEITVNDVRQHGQNAAAKTGRRHGVLASQVTARSWIGLEKLP